MSTRALPCPTPLPPHNASLHPLAHAHFSILDILSAMSCFWLALSLLLVLAA